MSRTVRGTKRDAERALAEFVAEAGEPRQLATAATVSELFTRWLEHAGDDLSPTTLREYQRLVEKRIEPALGSIALRRLSSTQIDAFYRALSLDEGLAPATVRQIHAMLRRALGQAVKWGWVRHNPAVDASPPRLRRHELAPPDATELQKLMELADVEWPDFAVALRLLAATGMRRGELCGLRWSDFSADRRSLVVQRSVTVAATGRKTIEKDTKTHASRQLALDAGTLEALRVHRARVDDRASRCGAQVPHDAFMFSPVADGSRPLHPDSISKAFSRLRGRVGLDHVRLHDLRHMHATQLLAAGVPVRTVSGRLGHANAATTLNVYGHFMEASDREAADVVGRLLGA